MRGDMKKVTTEKSTVFHLSDTEMVIFRPLIENFAQATKRRRRSVSKELANVKHTGKLFLRPFVDLAIAIGFYVGTVFELVFGTLFHPLDTLLYRIFPTKIIFENPTGLERLLHNWDGEDSQQSED